MSHANCNWLALHLQDSRDSEAESEVEVEMPKPLRPAAVNADDLLQLKSITPLDIMLSTHHQPSPTAMVGSAAPSQASGSQPNTATSLAAGGEGHQLEQHTSGCGTEQAQEQPPGQPKLVSLAEGEVLGALGSSLQAATLAGEDSSVTLIGAVKTFDTAVARTLSPIKTRSQTTEVAEFSPPAYVESLASPFEKGLFSLLPQAGQQRGPILHSHGNSWAQAPNAYDPNNAPPRAFSSGEAGLHFVMFLHCGVVLPEPHRSAAGQAWQPDNALLFAYPPSLPAELSLPPRPSPSKSSSSGLAAAAQRTTAAAAAAEASEEPDFVISIPGFSRRTSSNGLSRAASSNGGSSAAAPSAALSGAPSAAPSALPSATTSQELALLPSTRSSVASTLQTATSIASAPLPGPPVGAAAAGAAPPRVARKQLDMDGPLTHQPSAANKLGPVAVPPSAASQAMPTGPVQPPARTPDAWRKGALRALFVAGAAAILAGPRGGH